MSSISISTDSDAGLTGDLTAAAVALRDRIVGDVLLPTDDGYLAACTAWNVVFVHEPQIVVIAATIGDVTEAVRFAHAAGSRVAVQATGHGFARAARDGVL